MPLRFGIPSLDELLEIPATVKVPRNKAESVTLIGPDGCGKSVLALHLASRYVWDCFARLRTGCRSTAVLPKVLYISSDLQASGARRVWNSFELRAPNRRQIPFERTGQALYRLGHLPFTLDLVELFPGADDKSEDVTARGVRSPFQPRPLADFLLDEGRENDLAAQVGFLDLARNTAGDDWNYVNATLAQLAAVTRPDMPLLSELDNDNNDGTLQHLVIIDSVAGFETYVGKLDAYGLEQSRRARIAQCMRNAMPHCHLVFVVEEPQEGERLPEEYVTDIVVRVRARSSPERSLRTVEIEKARARNHALGEHPFEIRGPEGSSTGEWENIDAPRSKNAYVQVFHSLPHRNMLIALDSGKGRSRPNDTVLPFGAAYLDRLLTPGAAVGRDEGGAPAHGLTSASTSALIGDTSTGKSVLAEKFIAGGFLDVLKDAVHLYGLLAPGLGSELLGADVRAETVEVVGRLHRVLAGSSASIAVPDNPVDVAAYLLDAWEQGEQQAAEELQALMSSPGAKAGEPGHREQPIDLMLSLQREEDVIAWWARFANFEERDRIFAELRPPLPEAIARLQPERRLDVWTSTEGGLPRIHTHFRPSRPNALREYVRSGAWTEDRAGQFVVELFRHPNLRFAAVLLTTGDRTVPELTSHCFNHIGDDLDAVITRVCPLQTRAGLIRALWHIVSEQLIVRRFDIENATSAAVFHAIQQNVLEAQRLVHGLSFPPRQEYRFRRADRIRLVLDDCRVLASLCPSVGADPTFLPFLTFFLEREGVTSLIVYTDAVRPNVRPDDRTSQILQSLLRQVILTWSVPFEGKNRVAVSVVPASSSATNGIVREVKIFTIEPPPTFKAALSDRDDRVNGLSRISPSLGARVTPSFELYEGIEDGRPRIVPLAVYLFSATEGFRRYIEQTNRLFREMFSPVSNVARDERRVVWPLSVDDYLTLRDETHLPLGAQQKYTTVVQVEGFWSLQAAGGALMSQAEYLQQEFKPLSPDLDHEDPFGLFRGAPLYPPQPSGRQRKDYFCNTGYTSRIINFCYERYQQDGAPDRVPFTWDFGFILAPSRPWEGARTEPIESAGQDATGLTVEHVMNRLSDPDARAASEPVSWREFFGACKSVAEAARRQTGTDPVPFDYAASSPETLNCLLLEIWLSEVQKCAPQWLTNRFASAFEELSSARYVPFSEKRGLVLTDLLTCLPDGNTDCIGTAFGRFKADYETAYQARVHDVASQGLESSDAEAQAKRDELFAQLPIGALCLYKTWLLLLDVVRFEDLLDPENPLELCHKKQAAAGAVAVRHWYRTACPATSKALAADGIRDAPLLFRMPGSYSARADSFLASPSDSRSRLLAWHAMDLLSSRRANIERMRLGVGLPVRDILDQRAAEMPTALRHVSPGRKKPAGDEGAVSTPNASPSASRLTDVTYGELYAHGGGYFGDGCNPLWLYRSAIQGYDRINRALQNWLFRLIHWTITLKAEKGLRWEGGLRAYDALERKTFSLLFDYDSFEQFGTFCDLLVAETKAAKRRDD